MVEREAVGNRMESICLSRFIEVRPFADEGIT